MNNPTIILIITLILISSCTPKEECVPIIEYINDTITEYKEVKVIEYINTTIECDKNTSRDYIDRLIRDYERCRGEMRFLNNTNLTDNYYDLNLSLSRCEDKLEEMEEILG